MSSNRQATLHLNYLKEVKNIGTKQLAFHSAVFYHRSHSNESVMLIFGGSNLVNTNSFLYEYNLNSCNWKKIDTPQQSSGSIFSLTPRVKTDIISKLVVHKSVLVRYTKQNEPREKLFIFGGCTKLFHSETAQLLSYNLLKKKWKKISREGKSHWPLAISSCSMCVRNNKHIIIFGGKFGESTMRHKTMYKYNVLKKHWKLIDYEDNLQLRERYGHSADMRLFKRNRMVVFGGNVDEGSSCNELLQYNFKTRKWKELKCKFLVKPAPRDGHSCSIIGNNEESERLLLHGGNDGKQAFNDFWIYLFQNKEWIKVDIHPNIVTMEPRSYHSMIYDNLSNRVVIYGGWTPNVNQVSSSILDLRFLESKMQVNLYKAAITQHSYIDLLIECQWEKFE